MTVEVDNSKVVLPQGWLATNGCLLLNNSSFPFVKLTMTNGKLEVEKAIQIEDNAISYFVLGVKASAPPSLPTIIHTTEQLSAALAKFDLLKTCKGCTDENCLKRKECSLGKHFGDHWRANTCFKLFEPPESNMNSSGHEARKHRCEMSATSCQQCRQLARTL